VPALILIALFLFNTEKKLISVLGFSNIYGFMFGKGSRSGKRQFALYNTASSNCR
jgi:hypothetical protein